MLIVIYLAVWLTTGGSFCGFRGIVGVAEGAGNAIYMYIYTHVDR